MKVKIEHPKVFISYAWGTEEHNSNVLSFATDLKHDGIDVVLDRWQLKEGFDTYAFMEKSATDSSITNVLILLDPIYAKKADARSGGVGTETQIISPEVYNKVEQEKFIPVIFERNQNGDVCKPKYLRGLLHFDLTNEEKYDSEYQRLVRRLYGIDTIKEPELGNPPAWLEDIPQVKYKSKVNNEFYKGNVAEKVKKKKFSDDFSELTSMILSFDFNKENDVINQYKELTPLRDEFLLKVQGSDYVEEGYKTIISGLERLAETLRQRRARGDETKQTLIHELFVYIVAYYLKQQDWEALGYILNKTYYTGKSNFNLDGDSYNAFYNHNEELDREVCRRDNKNYYCGTATLWMELLNIEVCNKREFVFADLFCHNVSYLIENYKEGWKWFPITYVYAEQDSRSLMYNFSKRLCSKEHLQEMVRVTGYASVDEFIAKYKEVEDHFEKNEYEKYRYNSCFEDAQTFWDYTKSIELGIRN